ncbi:MAG: cytochrome c nitrite reductase small subunit [Pyrinomonadaceae bacterium]|nr:cytochrome c nitrite reductase small subunit [Pyrinomonadaceae bacterium]
MNVQILKLSLVGLAIGAAVGIGMFTFVYAKGYSYLSNDAAACANCHVMNDQYSGWLKSSHKNVATCNDCHTPPDSLLGKYYTKASNGFWHSYYFTFNNFHEPIQITERNRQVTEASCRHCHQDLTASITPHRADRDDEISCIRCHRSVGHMH